MWAVFFRFYPQHIVIFPEHTYTIEGVKTLFKLQFWHDLWITGKNEKNSK